MYRLTLWFDALDDVAAEAIVDKVAFVCDDVIGRPSTEADDVPYILLWEPAEQNFEAWLRANVLRDGVRGVIVPRAYSEAPLQ